MLDMEIGRTTCKKTKHPSLDNCDFQTNHTLKMVNKGASLLRPLATFLAPPATRPLQGSGKHSFIIPLPTQLQISLLSPGLPVSNRILQTQQT